MVRGLAAAAFLACASMALGFNTVSAWKKNGKEVEAGF